ncbi:phage/plasmid primase, P4 family [Bifidobacterium sp. ESL0775]|uniref:DNA primase family protein n=1 Tax=Bifidobacterium sp. ESL0775 TaxID=2983230 RepID=UPI0023F85537|nr:phage/plasmid primase, P4 family [Bifidobacterium sp. ESL0775]WEV68846.1 phage/plasmid primase, P4 family [Bifidobacterium sp. ESL0775]
MSKGPKGKPVGVDTSTMGRLVREACEALGCPLRVVRREVGRERGSQLCAYDKESGVYLPSDVVESDIAVIARVFAESIFLPVTKREVDEVIAEIHDMAPRVTLTSRSEYVPLANGVWDVKGNVLKPFSPDLVFLAKGGIPYNPQAESPVIDGWEAMSWLKDTYGDELVPMIREMLKASLIPSLAVRARKAIFLVGDGSNGKSTLLNLMVSIVGREQTASLPLSVFNDPSQSRWIGASLEHTSLVIGDDNDANTYFNDSSMFKSIISGGEIKAEHKGKDSYLLKPCCLVVQAFNDLPRVKDKSEAMLDRIVVVKLTKQFKDHARRPEIGDYLQRTDVLSYLLTWALLCPDFGTWAETEFSRRALEEWALENDPVKEWWFDIHDQLYGMSEIPSSALYELYERWFKRNHPLGRIVGRIVFGKALRPLAESDGWQLGVPSISKSRLPTLEGREDYVAETISESIVRSIDQGKHQVRGLKRIPRAKEAPAVNIPPTRHKPTPEEMLG